MKNIELCKVMSASGVFGPEFAYKKIKKILESYPDILTTEDDKNTMLKKLNKCGIKTIAEQFVDNIDNFKRFLKIHDMITIQANENKKETKTSGSFDKTVVFTGFRDSDLEKKITSLGGKVALSVSKKTDIVIYKTPNTNSVKELKARELGIPIMSLDDFKKMVIK